MQGLEAHGLPDAAAALRRNALEAEQAHGVLERVGVLLVHAHHLDIELVEYSQGPDDVLDAVPKVPGRRHDNEISRSEAVEVVDEPLQAGVVLLVRPHFQRGNWLVQIDAAEVFEARTEGLG